MDTVPAVIAQAGIWRRTLAAMPGKGAKSDPHAGPRSRLRRAFIDFRNKASVMAAEITGALPTFTVHDISHIDALWGIADDIVGDDYPIEPTEAFVLGGAFLLHDLGMALASYPAGVTELESDPRWQDAASQAFRQAHGRRPSLEEISSLGDAVRREATEQTLRLRHAEQAEQLATIGYRHKDRDTTYHLISDEDLRDIYGPLIGRIAYSHWWPAKDLLAEFAEVIGTIPGFPRDWKVDPLKIALILRVSDACHLDALRAPGFLRTLRKPAGEAEKHWRFQEYIQAPYVENQRVIFSSTKGFPLDDFEAWWLCYEALNLADRELHGSDTILRDSGRPPFMAHTVAGANDPDRLARHIRTAGWKPVATTLRVGNVASLVRKLGGQGLYGETMRVPLRELIQNARDAVVALRIKHDKGNDWGHVTVRLIESDGLHAVEVQDTGVGMSEELLAGPFLDFGASYWDSSLMLREHPGLASRGFEPQGRFGIGFFSVFMWGEYVKVVTRRPEDGVSNTRVLEFRGGLSARPVLRAAELAEQLRDSGTIVHVRLDRAPSQGGGILAPEPIPSRLGVRMSNDKRWSLRELCAWLCPAIDVDLYTVQDGTKELAVKASDWETMSGHDLVRRLLLHREDLDTVLADPVFQTIIPRIEDIRTSTGRLIGRGALVPTLYSGIPDGHPYREASVVTAGGFRSLGFMDFVGLLLGNPETASRFQARAIASEYLDSISAWATQQAAGPYQIRALSESANILLNRDLAMIVRALGGDTRGLPIARLGDDKLISFDEIASIRDLPNEVVLHQDAWGVYGWSPAPLPDNGIAVSSGKMLRPTDFSIKSDPKQRAHHPKWACCWMTLWAATIEAIARAWGVPLQEVLDASEIASRSDEQSVAENGRISYRLTTDTIRNPKAFRTS